MDEPPSHILSQQGTVIAIVAVFLLAFISALVCASEAAFFSLGENDLNALRRSTKRKDGSILQLLERPHLLLLTCVVLNVFSKVGMVTISTLLIWDVNIPNVVGAVALFVTTLSILIFGDMAARTYATKKNFQVTEVIIGPWKVLMAFLKPITMPIMKAREFWAKRVEKNKSVEDELNQAFELASEAAETTESEKDILRGIVNFGTLNVKQVMRTRTEIDAINADLNFDELIAAVNTSGFSRIPVFNKTIDAIEGVLYTKDLLPFLGYPSNFVWHQLIRPPFVVTETKKIDLLLKDFQEKRVHVAIVRDEKGNTSGLVTLEDLIEEIIGDINDEFDEVDATLQSNADGIQRSDRKNTTPDSLAMHDMDPERFNQSSVRHHRTSRETENQPREGGHV